MSTRDLLRGVAVAAASIFAVSGCSFWGFDGSGPVDKDTAYRLYGRAPWKLSAVGYRTTLDSSFDAVPWSVMSRETAGLAGDRATFRQSTRHFFGTMLLLGYTETESRILLDKGGDKGAEKGERLFGHASVCLPGFPIAAFWLSNRELWYSLDKGEELSLRFSHGLGPAGVIAGHTQCIIPADIPQVAGNMLHTGTDTFGQYLAAVVATRGEDARYNSQWGWHILGGIVAWGRVNYQYFFQVAWVPIPLWRIQE